MPHSHAFAVAMVVNAAAVLVFVVLMSAFWWFFGSDEVRNSVRRKTQILVAARRSLAECDGELRDAGLLLDATLHRQATAARVDAERSAAARRAHNKRLLYDMVGPVVAALTGLLAGLAAHNALMVRHGGRADHRMSPGHWGGLLLVFLGYLPEVLFFLFVIEMHVPIGDYELMRRACRFL